MFSIYILPKPESTLKDGDTLPQKKIYLDLLYFIYLISWREFVGWWLVYLIKNSQPLILRGGANYFWPKSFVGNVHLLTQDWLFDRHFISVTIESYFGSFIIAFVLKFAVKSMIPLS